MQIVDSPLPQFFESDGSPLDDGFVYVGVAGLNPETSPTAVFWDPDGLLPAAQPLRTNNGFISRTGTPSFVFCADLNYSLSVRDKRGNLVFSSPSVVPGGSGTVAFVSALYFVGDTDTGIINPTAGTIALQTDGVQRMQVDGGGLVGINGAAVGSTRLTVHDATGNGQIRARHSTGLGLLINQSAASGAASILLQDNAGLSLGTNNLPRWTLSAAGDVTLSTSVAGTLSSAVVNANAAVSAFASHRVESNAGTLRMIMGSTASGGGATVLSDATGPLSMYSTTATEVRIGTNNNANRLVVTVAGDVNVAKGSGALLVGGSITRSEAFGTVIGATTYNDTVSHSGPRVPDVVQASLRCVVPDLGYALNDELPINTMSDANLSGCIFTIFKNATQVGTRMYAGYPVIVPKGGGSLAAITVNCWQMVYRCLWL